MKVGKDRQQVLENCKRAHIVFCYNVHGRRDRSEILPPVQIGWQAPGGVLMKFGCLTKGAGSVPSAAFKKERKGRPGWVSVWLARDYPLKTVASSNTKGPVRGRILEGRFSRGRMIHTAVARFSCFAKSTDTHPRRWF